MAYDLQEQDQLDAFRAFWKQYGNTILLALTLVLLAVGGWRGWAAYQQRQATTAAGLYAQLEEAVRTKNLERLKEATQTLTDQYGRTVYGGMAALLAARSHAEAGDVAAAKAALKWAVERASESEIKLVARLRLAGLLLDEKAYDDGLALLTGVEAGAFEPLFADRRGDLLQASGRTDDARSAYRAALERLEPNAALRPWVQIKLDALGGA